MPGLRHYYRLWKAQGLCTRCGSHPANEGKTLCEPCRLYFNAHQQKSRGAGRDRKTYAARKAAGVCVRCGDPSRPLKTVTVCEPCLSQTRAGIEPKKPAIAAKSRARYRKNLAAGVCVTCAGKHGPRVMSYRCLHCREKHLASCSRRNRIIKEKVFAGYGGYRCACCGETEPLFMTLDHINNDGKQHRELMGPNLRRFYLLMLRAGCPAGIQVLCYNCNVGKYKNGGVCPHQSAKGALVTT